MEILFKDDEMYFFIDDEGRIDYLPVSGIDSRLLSDIQHLDDMEPIYHIISSNGRHRYSVYYVFNEQEVIFCNESQLYLCGFVEESDTIDYTEVNINKLLNGNII